MSYDFLLYFIANNDWKNILEKAPFCLKIKQCPFENEDGTLKYPELYMLSYNQIESDFHNEIVRCCRGCIVSVEDPDNPKMVCAPFYKFGNYGESYADKVNWDTAKVLEKVDGSLLKLFHYKNEWIWVTNNGWNIGCDCPVTLVSSFEEPETDSMTTFEQLKDYAVKKHFSEEFKLFARCRPNVTYMFELLSPKNRIICDNAETELVVLGARDNTTYDEYTEHEVLTDVAFRRPKTFELTNIDDVLALCDSYKDAFNEGVVVRDGANRRFKIKCAHYLTLKGFKGEIGFTEAKVLEAIRAESIDDVIGAFPEIEKTVDMVKQKLISYTKKVNAMKMAAYIEHACLMDDYLDEKIARKHFAKWVVETDATNSKYYFAAIDSDKKFENATKTATIEEIDRVCSL